jgi:hypothetical protein
MVNPIVSHQHVKNLMSNQARPQPVDPSSFTKCPGCNTSIAVGARSHADHCPMVYLRNKYTNTNTALKLLRKSSNVSVVWSAMVFFATLGNIQKMEWQKEATAEDG